MPAGGEAGLAIDAALLEEHRGFVDPAAAIRESFLTTSLAGQPTVAVLTEPLTRTRSRAWVICHSLGVERVNLHRLEVLAARALAAAGFPVLRYDTPGYGESRRRGEPVLFSDHVSAARDAVGVLAEHTGARTIGVIGARFGALLAAVVADADELEQLALWQPFPDGDAFLANFHQAARFGRLIDRGAAPSVAEDRPGPAGEVDLNGFVLTQALEQEIAAIDLRRLRLRGRALVVGLSETGALPAGAAAVVAHLREVGVACAAELVEDRGAGLFGQHQFQRMADGRGEVDALRGAYDHVIDATVRWSRSLEGEGP